jgi:P-type Mg2+ transporter
MLIFGSLSSVFDVVTFAVLLLFLHAGPAEFRTGWFLESVISATAAVLVVRTRRPFFRSRPGRGLVLATGLVAAITLVFPILPIGPIFGFSKISGFFYLLLGLIVILYIGTAEAVKIVFYRRTGKSHEA